MASCKEGGAGAGLGGLGDVLAGRGLSLASFLQLLLVVGGALLLSNGHPTFGLLFELATSGAGRAVLLCALLWVAPLHDAAYAVDRLGAIRAQSQFLAPYALDLLPTAHKMLPHMGKIIANIETVGPMVPVCMAPGVKEHMLPVLPEMMADLEVMLPIADLLLPVIPKIAPHIRDILPFTKELLPYTPQLLPILEVEGWYLVNPHLDKVVPHISKIAPHAKLLAKHMPAMLPYMDILIAHVDQLMEQFEETVPVLDKLIPLLPLLPAAEQAGLLNQKLAFAALPTVVGMVPLSNATTGALAIKTAVLHDAVLQRAGSAKRALLERYQLYQAKPSVPAIADAVADATPQ